MRDNYWLKQKLDMIWGKYFSDVKKLNDIHIHFGRKAKRRLASIRQINRFNKNSDTEIKITGYYKNHEVPEYIIDVTIAHELCHYAHGFASPLPKFSKFPHRGDVVDNELRQRGLGKMLALQEEWLHNSWNNVVKTEIFVKKHSYVRKIRKKKSPVLSFIRKLVFSS